jgi:hypothetical protein
MCTLCTVLERSLFESIVVEEVAVEALCIGVAVHRSFTSHKCDIIFQKRVGVVST